MIYAIDFDGTLCTDEYPKIGAPRYEVIAFARAAKRAGDRLILWTCREGKELAAAVEWCSELGLTFDAARNARSIGGESATQTTPPSKSSAPTATTP